MNEVRQAFLDAAQAAADLVALPDVAARWDDPGACVGMTVGGIATHLVSSGIEMALAVVEGPAPEPSGRLLLPGRYFSGQSVDLGNAEHQAIRASSNDAAATGVERVRARATDALGTLSKRLVDEGDDRLVLVLGRFTMTLDGMLTTRLVELLAHGDDLATSLEVDHDPPPHALTIVLECLTDVARRRHGDRAVLRTVARGGRTEPVFPTF